MTSLDLYVRKSGEKEKYGRGGGGREGDTC